MTTSRFQAGLCQPKELPRLGSADGAANTAAGIPMPSPMDQNIVPQQPGGIPHRLNGIEKQELELARRRAEKAAEGKRANAAAARARRRASRPRLEERTGGDDEGDASQGEEDDLEAKLAATKDEKEAKRLRR